MKLELKLDPACAEPTVQVTVPRMTPEVQALLRRLEEPGPDGLPGWQGDCVTLLDRSEILRCYTANKGVFAQTEHGEYALRLRLYELEEQLDPRVFVRVSHSEIVNLKKVTALDLSLSGTIKLTLQGGGVCWVSRRNVKNIKWALGL
jgi:DNA-binding LytR/AlgR family response regulator